MYKWASILHVVSRLKMPDSDQAGWNEGGAERRGLGIGEGEGGCLAVDIGGGSAPLQFFMSKSCDVINIDINFLSSWFPVDRCVLLWVQDCF